MVFPPKSGLYSFFADKTAAIFLLALGFLLTFSSVSRAAELNISGGLKFGFLVLERDGKNPSTGASFEAESSEKTAPGLSLTIKYGRWFLGWEGYQRSYGVLWVEKNNPSVSFDDKVEVSEMNMALGFFVSRGFGPFLAFSSHKQTREIACTGCKKTFTLSGLGPGLSLATTFPKSRFGAYARGSYVKGYDLEGGFSYSWVRVPVVAAAGFRHRFINYSSREVLCGDLAVGCYRSRDLFFGPTVSVVAVF